MIVERRLLPHLDWPLVVALVALTVIGVATIYSVTWNHVAGAPGREFWTQVYALPVAFAALAACLLIDYRTLTQRSLLIYGGLVLALLYVAFFGTVREGARRWMLVGGVSLQPSEFARLVIALVLWMVFRARARKASARTLERGEGRDQAPG